MEKPEPQVIEEKIIDGSLDESKIPSQEQADVLIRKAVEDTVLIIKTKKKKGAK